MFIIFKISHLRNRLGNFSNTQTSIIKHEGSVISEKLYEANRVITTENKCLPFCKTRAYLSNNLA